MWVLSVGPFDGFFRSSIPHSCEPRFSSPICSSKTPSFQATILLNPLSLLTSFMGSDHVNNDRYPSPSIHLPHPLSLYVYHQPQTPNLTTPHSPRHLPSKSHHIHTIPHTLISLTVRSSTRAKQKQSSCLAFLTNGLLADLMLPVFERRSDIVVESRPRDLVPTMMYFDGVAKRWNKGFAMV